MFAYRSKKFHSKSINHAMLGVTFSTIYHMVLFGILNDFPNNWDRYYRKQTTLLNLKPKPLKAIKNFIWNSDKKDHHLFRNLLVLSIACWSFNLHKKTRCMNCTVPCVMHIHTEVYRSVPIYRYIVSQNFFLLLCFIHLKGRLHFCLLFRS